jgi:hypothetical protein
MNAIKNTILKGDDNLSDLKWLAIDSFFAGLMLFGFFQSIVDSRWLFTLIFAILFSVDFTKAHFEYKQVRRYLK